MSDLETREGQLQELSDLRREIHQLAENAVDVKPAPSGSEYEAWTFKDLVAHLNGWRLLTAARLEAGVEGGEPATVWPNGWTEEDNLDEINAWLFEENREKSLAQILQESDELFARMERAVRELPMRAMMEKGRFAWLSDYPLVAVIEGTAEHQEEHRDDLVEKAKRR